MSETENQPTVETVNEQIPEENVEKTDREVNNITSEELEENKTTENSIEEAVVTEEKTNDSISEPEPQTTEEINNSVPESKPETTEEDKIEENEVSEEKQEQPEDETVETFEEEAIQLSESNKVNDDEVEAEETFEEEAVQLSESNEVKDEVEAEETFEEEAVQLSESNEVKEEVEAVQLSESNEVKNEVEAVETFEEEVVQYSEPNEIKDETEVHTTEEEEKPKEKLDDSIPLTQEANKALLVRSNSIPSQIAPLEADDIDYNTLSKEELVEKVLFFKEQCKIIKQESDKKIKNTNDYIVRLEEATEQRLDRLRKQNRDEIDEIKKISDQLIKNEKEKAETYVKNMKKSVDEERDVLRSIENDSRSRFQKEKEEKNEALVEVNRLKSIINSLHNDVEDRENKIQNLEEKNLSVFVQKDKELEQAINQIENERKHSKQVNEENKMLKEKINELNDELKQFKNESEIRNSQINLLNNDNQQMSKKITILTRKNEELNTLYEFKLDEAASLKAQIESLNNKIEHYRRKRHNRLNGISPLTPNNMNTPVSAFDPNASRCFSEMSFISNPDSLNKSFNSNKILDALDDRKTSTANTNTDQLSDISLGYNENEEKDKDSVVNNDGIVTMSNITAGAPEVETVEIVGGGDANNEIININNNDEEKPEQRTLVIDTNMAISNTGGDPAFNYQESNMVVMEEEEENEDEEEDEDNEETIMGSMVKPLVFHTNDQTFINFNENLSEDYSKIYNTKLVKQCELEEIVQCLDLNGTFMGFFSKRKLLNGLKNNTVVIEKANTSNFQDLLIKEIEPECALCSLKYANNENTILWYKFFFEDEKTPEHEFICMFCRERLVTICNWYKYLSMISKKIVKHDVETIYINCLQLKENMYHARNGLTTDEDNSILNVVSANPRQEIIAQRPGDFIDVEIENGNGLVKKMSFESTTNSADSVTIKNNSEIIDLSQTSTTLPGNKRPSLCYNNTIQKKISISSPN